VPGPGTLLELADLGLPIDIVILGASPSLGLIS